MSSTDWKSDRVVMQGALRMARDVLNACATIPYCQASDELRARVRQWAAQSMEALGTRPTYRRMWEGETIRRAFYTHSNWLTSLPEDADVVYTEVLDGPGPTQRKLNELSKKLGEVSVAYLAYRRAYEASKQAVYLASQSLALANEELWRVLPPEYVQPEAPCGLTGEEQ